MLTYKVLCDLDHMTGQNKRKKKVSRKEKTELSSAATQRQGSSTECQGFHVGLDFCLPQIKFPYHEMRFCKPAPSRVTALQPGGGVRPWHCRDPLLPTRCSPLPHHKETLHRSDHHPPSSSSPASPLTLSSNLTYLSFGFWGRKPLWGDFCRMQEVREHGAVPGPALVAWCLPHGGRTSISSHPPLRPRGGEGGLRGSWGHSLDSRHVGGGHGADFLGFLKGMLLVKGLLFLLLVLRRKRRGLLSRRLAFWGTCTPWRWWGYLRSQEKGTETAFVYLTPWGCNFPITLDLTEGVSATWRSEPCGSKMTPDSTGQQSLSFTATGWGETEREARDPQTTPAQTVQL